MKTYDKPQIESVEIEAEESILAGLTSDNTGGVGGDLPSGEGWD